MLVGVAKDELRPGRQLKAIGPGISSLTKGGAADFFRRGIVPLWAGGRYRERQRPGNRPSNLDNRCKLRPGRYRFWGLIPRLSFLNLDTAPKSIDLPLML